MFLYVTFVCCGGGMHQFVCNLPSKSTKLDISLEKTFRNFPKTE